MLKLDAGLSISRFYHSEIGELKSYIVLGDFGEDGWRMCKQRANLPLDHILLAGKFENSIHCESLLTLLFEPSI